jgi:hypothetical protein
MLKMLLFLTWEDNTTKVIESCLSVKVDIGGAMTLDQKAFGRKTFG